MDKGNEGSGNEIASCAAILLYIAAILVYCSVRDWTRF